MWEKFWSWLVVSSANPDKVAATVKGYIMLTISALLYFSPIFHLNLGQAQLTTIGDLIIQSVVIIAGIISAFATLLGLTRKIYLTWFSA